MTDTLHLEIITASGAVVDMPAAQITLPLADGEVGILPGHAPLLGALMCGVVRYTAAGKEHKLIVYEGGDHSLEKTAWFEDAIAWLNAHPL